MANPYDEGALQSLLGSKGAQIYWSNWNMMQDWYHSYMLPEVERFHSQIGEGTKKTSKKKRDKRRRLKREKRQKKKKSESSANASAREMPASSSAESVSPEFKEFYQKTLQHRSDLKKAKEEKGEEEEIEYGPDDEGPEERPVPSTAPPSVQAGSGAAPFLDILLSMEITTPIYSHVYKYEDVYEPAEDTFLLLDVLEGDAETLKKLRPVIVVEIGSGSGLVSTFAAKIIGKSASYFCTDKNPSAAACTLETGVANSIILNPVVTGFVDGLLPRLKHQVDLLIFNPPYVVTPSEEIEHGGISYAWAGGVRGREVMDAFFPFVPDLLSQSGLFYLVVLKENDPDSIVKLFEKFGIFGETVKTRRSGPEVLSVLRFSRTKRKS